jgi:hypothetical protein
MPDIPAGIASMTDRALPHLLPTPDGALFAETLQRAIEIDSPPPVSASPTTSSSLTALGSLGTDGFYSPTAQRRIAVVLTDGESRPFAEHDVALLLRGRHPVKLVLVHVWQPGEEVFTAGRPESRYQQDTTSGAVLASLAKDARGRAFEENRLGDAAGAVRHFAGAGPTVTEREPRGKTALAPYLALGAVVPLGLLLLRRAV